MDKRLTGILDSLLLNIETLNDELMRLTRTEQFHPTTHCFQLIESIRGSCMCSLQNLRTIERRLHGIQKSSEAAKPADIFPIQDNFPS